MVMKINLQRFASPKRVGVVDEPSAKDTTYLISGKSLTGIADSIRGVNGETVQYTPEEMKTKISALKDPKGSVTIATNGTYDVSQKATAIVEVPPTPTQEKNFTISDNNTYSVEPDTGYALSKVLVTGKFSNPTLNGTATNKDVLAGKTFYNTSYTLQNGGIQTYGGATTITSNTTLATAGMYLDKNLVINVPSPTLSGNAIASQVLKGQKFYSNSYVLQTGTMESYNGDFIITQNGTISIAHMYVNSDIVVNVPATPTQEKSITITENGTTEVTPDTGKHLSKVTITTNVPSSGGGVEDVSTNAEMTAKLTSENVGNYYRFVGATDSDYVSGDLYLVQLPQLSSPTGVAIEGTTLSWEPVDNAESYDIYADGVLIGNTTGEVTPTGETWVFNETLSASKTEPQTFTINFTSNGIEFTSIEWSTSDAGKGALMYRGTDDKPVYAPPWADEAYRTIILSEPASSDLLTWLQANATKQ